MIDYVTLHEEAIQDFIDTQKELYNAQDTITDLQEHIAKLDRHSISFGNALFDILNELENPAIGAGSLREVIKLIAETALKACK